jgi:hypothetical protein
MGTTVGALRLLAETRKCLALLCPYSSTVRLALVFFLARRGSGMFEGKRFFFHPNQYCSSPLGINRILSSDRSKDLAIQSLDGSSTRSVISTASGNS